MVVNRSWFVWLLGTWLCLVSAPGAGQGAGGDDLFLAVQATPQKVMVQGQVVLTVQFFRAIEIAGAALSAPELAAEQAVLERLGEDRAYTSSHQGRPYQVVERRYALFPQKSGRLTIPPLRLEVQSGRRGLFAFLDDSLAGRSGEIKRRFSEAVEIEVEPMASQAQGERHWLPAHRVQLLEKWQESSLRLQVGESVTRTLTLLADGLTAAQLPELAPLALAGQGEEMKYYPDQPQLRDQHEASGIIGMRQEKVAMVPTRAGKVVLPAIEVAWWNVDEGRREVARIAARTVEVAAAAQAQQPVRAPAASQGPAEVGAAPEVPARQGGAVAEPATAWLVPFLALGWGVTVLLWGISGWRRRQAAQPVAAAEVQTVAQADHWAVLQRACQDGAAPLCRTALLSWAQARWPEARLAHLHDLEHFWQRQGWHELVQELHDLHRCSFASQGEVWQGARLWQQLHALPASTRSGHHAVLPALYPLEVTHAPP
ncbi:MAG: BatD family protein [Magnetococcales bacterium]|nr:BatD family protein [Magnetococcales bacterium]MBF0116282.1 BatD family protein [Magnetococcales bacterium]